MSALTNLFGPALYTRQSRVFDQAYGATRLLVGREPVETPVKDEGLRRPTEGRPRIRILAAGELDVEAAAEFAGLSQRGGVERADDWVARPATHPPEALLEQELEYHLALSGHAPVAVEDEDEVPTVSTEFEALGTNATDGGAGARRVEPQVGLEPEKLWRDDPAER